MTRLNWDRTEPSGEYPSGGVAAAPATWVKLFGESRKEVVQREQRVREAKKAKLARRRNGRGKIG